MGFSKKPFAAPYNKYKVSAKEDRTLDGVVFDSKWELKVYQWLTTHVSATFELQPKFVLLEKFRDFEGKAQREIAYFADFKIWSDTKDQYIIVDAKGLLTSDFKLKKKLFMSRYPGIPLYLPKNEKQLKAIPWEKHGIKIKNL